MKLLIADDHPIFRKGLIELLKVSFADAEIIECSDGTETMQKIKSEAPTIAVLDINMPFMNGLEITHEIQLKGIETRVIILTMYKEKEMVMKAMEYGAYGFVLKDFAVNELTNCIQKVLLDQKYIGPTLKESYNHHNVLEERKQTLLDTFKDLTTSEIKTLKLVNQNKTSKEIAELLFLTEKTVENYRSKICQKLGLPPRNNSLIIWLNENKEFLSVLNEF